jgi:hypothetical protein
MRFLVIAQDSDSQLFQQVLPKEFGSFEEEILPAPCCVSDMCALQIFY